VLWGEWLSSAPTLVFLTLTLNGKNELNTMDKCIMISFFTCIFFGFLPIIPQPQYLGYVWVSMAAICCVPVLLLPWYVLLEERQAASYIEEGEGNEMLRSKKQSRQFYSALWLSLSCPLFPLNYLLAATRVIGPADSAGVFLLLTLLMKAFYAASVADVHTHSLMDVQKDEERRERARHVHDLEKERYANASRRIFFKYLFHEVRTPLNSLAMGIELLKTRTVLEQSDLELLDMMDGAMDFMAETLNNVLSMQKIEEGKMELAFIPFNISDSIAKIFFAMSGAAMAKGLQVEKHIAAEVPPRLVGDIFRVEHVMSNLLSNAIKFSPMNGTIRVNVRAAPAVATATESPFTDVTVSISDEGPGISAENQEKLFSGFFQVRPDQLQQGKGSGLGLALCKEIVTLHGGTIGVESVEGLGSTFRFCIPFPGPNDESIAVADKRGVAEPELEPERDWESELPQTASATVPIRASTIKDTFADCSLGESGRLEEPVPTLCILVVDGMTLRS